MPDPRFFTRAQPMTLSEIADRAEAVVYTPEDSGKQVIDVVSLAEAGPEHLSFLDNKLVGNAEGSKYTAQFKETRAGACLVREEMVAFAPPGTVCLVTKNPYRSYALAAQAFYPSTQPHSFVASSAIVDASAVIGNDCVIEHGAVIGSNVEIGARCHIGAHAVIESGVRIGDDTTISAHAYITHALIGNKVTVYPGAVIGRPGFGFAMDARGFVSVPQLGRVIIEDMVEIGANTTIDRGAGPDTVIGMGTRIDNLVQIGHNVQTGKFCVIVSQTGISGSTKLGDFVMTGGQAGIAGHLSIGSGAKIAAQSGVMRDVEPKAEVMGSPAVPLKQFMRQVVQLAKTASRKKES